MILAALTSLLVGFIAGAVVVSIGRDKLEAAARKRVPSRFDNPAGIDYPTHGGRGRTGPVPPDLKPALMTDAQVRAAIARIA